jgi:hypothetical protein
MWARGGRYLPGNFEGVKSNAGKRLAIRNVFGTPEFRNIGAIDADGSDRRTKAGGLWIQNYLVNIMR